MRCASNKINTLFHYTFVLIVCWILASYAYAPFIEDKSNNKTQIEHIIKVHQKNYLEFLRTLLKSAKSKKIPLSIKGTQHSQGGHTFYKNAWVLDLSFLNQMEMIEHKILRVQAGARWKEVLDFLNDRRLSVSVMQSDYDFTIGGTLSTNVHGWQANKEPFIHTVKGFHIMLADGTYKYCSRKENTELFRAVIGGYGLLGVVIDVDLKVVENCWCHLSQHIIVTSDFKNKVLTYVIQNPKASLFFGRFSCDSQNFLKKIIFNVYEDQGNTQLKSHLSQRIWLQNIIKSLFSLTYQSDLFKDFRWWIESNSFLRKFYTKTSRNTLLYHSVDNYFAHKSDHVDLLQEFFIPLENFEKFVNFLQSLQSEMIDSIMNITIRHVLKDQESILKYAIGDRIAFVMYFRGKKDTDFDLKLKKLVVKITDQALNLGGSYYLPYRAYQSFEQFEKSYHDYLSFKKIKIKYDPDKVFMNQFYESYLN